MNINFELTTTELSEMITNLSKLEKQYYKLQHRAFTLWINDKDENPRKDELYRNFSKKADAISTTLTILIDKQIHNLHK